MPDVIDTGPQVGALLSNLPAILARHAFRLKIPTRYQIVLQAIGTFAECPEEYCPSDAAERAQRSVEGFQQSARACERKGWIERRWKPDGSPAFPDFWPLAAQADALGILPVLPVTEAGTNHTREVGEPGLVPAASPQAGTGPGQMAPKPGLVPDQGASPRVCTTTPDLCVQSGCCAPAEAKTTTTTSTHSHPRPFFEDEVVLDAYARLVSIPPFVKHPDETVDLVGLLTRSIVPDVNPLNLVLKWLGGRDTQRYLAGGFQAARAALLGYARTLPPDDRWIERQRRMERERRRKEERPDPSPTPPTQEPKVSPAPPPEVKPLAASFADRVRRSPYAQKYGVPEA